MSFKKIDQRGSALLFIIIIIPYMILITTYFIHFAVTSYGLARKDQFRTHAQFAADAGIDHAIREINASSSYSGTGGLIEFHNDGKICTRYQTTITPDGPVNKLIVATAVTHSPVTTSCATSPVRSTVNITVNLRAVQSGNFSIVTGVGGLFMSNSAKVLGGDVFVNGELQMTGNSQIGLSTSSVNLDVAHQNCPNPPDATYPRVCNSGENGQPISISNPAHIYGNVKANNQTDGSRMSDPGLIAGSGVVPQPLPTHDRNAQKAAVVTTKTGGFSCNNGTHTWPANYKIVGNVSITNSCNVILLGDVWITGTFEIKNSQTKIIVSDALGLTKPTIMIDGTKAEFRNSSKIQSNIQNTGAQIITYWSRASCSPDCANVTGNDLYNSRSDTTIDFDQSAEGPHSIFYARWTRVTVNNSGQLGALVGQTIELKNSGTITFGTSVGTGNTYFVIDGYRRVR